MKWRIQLRAKPLTHVAPPLEDQTHTDYVEPIYVEGTSRQICAQGAMGPMRESVLECKQSPLRKEHFLAPFKGQRMDSAISMSTHPRLILTLKERLSSEPRLAKAPKPSSP